MLPLKLLFSQHFLSWLKAKPVNQAAYLVSPHLHAFCNSCMYLITEFDHFSLLNTLSVPPSLSWLWQCMPSSFVWWSLLTDIPIPNLFPFLSIICATDEGYLSIRNILLCYPMLKMIQGLPLTHRNSDSVAWNTQPLRGNPGVPSSLSFLIA